MATATTTHHPNTPKDPDTAMLEQHTLDQLRSLRLDGMIAALADTGAQSAAAAPPFEQRLALLVQRELDRHDGKRVARLLKVSSACGRTSTGVPAVAWIATSSLRWPAATRSVMAATC